MRYFQYLVPLTLLLACCQKAATDAKADAILSHIQPVLQIEGKPVINYTIEERLKMLHIPGISIAVVENGRLAWARAYGMADSVSARPVSTETLFLAGSISKPVAALAALTLVEEGKLNLEENVNNKLTSWRLPDNEFTVREKVTLRRILNHTAGLTVWGFPGYNKGDNIPSVVDVLDGKGNTDSVRVYKEPGESWMYSGGGYTIMQLMMTDVEHKPFSQIMRERVLTPLGMDQSTYENPLPVPYHSKAATGYRTDGNEVEGKWPIYPEMAAAGLWTTPSQLVKYAQAIHKIYLNDEQGVISKTMVIEMLTPGKNNYGLGPGISKDGARWGHDGADRGFRAELVAWKDQANAIVVMVNSDNGKIIDEVLDAIAKSYGWPRFIAPNKKVVKISKVVGDSLAGKWDIERVGLVTITYENGFLMLSGTFTDEPVIFLAESDTAFFEKDEGQLLIFSKKNGKVNELKVGALTGVRVQ